MTKVYVTKKGSEMPSNKWEEGDEISVHENIAELFITRGIATRTEITKSDSESLEKPLKTKKTK